MADAEAATQRALALGEQALIHRAGQFYGAQLFHLRRRQGRAAELEPAVRAFAEQYPALPIWGCGLALLYMEMGRRAEARQVFDGLAANGFADLPRDGNWMPAMAHLAEVCAYLGDQDRAAQYREGAGVEYEDYVGRDSDVQPVQDPMGSQVKFVVARHADEVRDDAAPRAEVDEIVAVGGARQIWKMKKMKTTAGANLDQSKNTGWDVNLDGMPHIGLYPDFLQDVRNVGVSWERMTPIFNAVEDYVRMWERQCELADQWAAQDGSVPGCHPAQGNN